MTMLLRAGHDVAIDATNLTLARRAYWRQLAVSICPNIRVRILWFQGQWDSSARWCAERGHSEAEYLRIRRTLEAVVQTPTPGEADELDFMECAPGSA